MRVYNDHAGWWFCKSSKLQCVVIFWVEGKVQVFHRNHTHVFPIQWIVVFHFFGNVEAVNFVFWLKKNVLIPVADKAVWLIILFCVLAPYFDFFGQDESEKLADFVWKALHHTDLGIFELLENEHVAEDVPVGDWLCKLVVGYYLSFKNLYTFIGTRWFGHLTPDL